MGWRTLRGGGGRGVCDDFMNKLSKHLVGLKTYTENSCKELRWTLSKISEAHEGPKTQGANDK